jgi:preprotein translocase subunit YajC
MKPGDKVVTSGGIYGKIRDIKDDGTVTIEIAENVRIKVDKSSVFLSMQDVQQQQK